ncbi:MAG: redoxin domain-containing protein [Anaerolineales bacterium]
MMAAARIHAPELAAGEWLNTPRPWRLAELRGRAVVIDFWDFTCLNCLRTLPYLAAWHAAFKDFPISFIGIHTPEFNFAKDLRQVEAAARRLGVRYPVLLDNDYRNWQAFANRYWPTLYLVDARGYIRYQHSGEGAYAEIESRLAELAGEAATQAGSPGGPLRPARQVGTLRPEDQPGAVCFKATPELHTGYDRGSLGNPEGYLPRSLPLIYQLPPADKREANWFYAEGAWQAGDDYFALAGEQGTLLLPYQAASANAVLSISADPVELMLGLKQPAQIVVTQDGAPLDEFTAGADIVRIDGQSVLWVDAPRLYEIARNPLPVKHELRLEARARGLAVFAFTFSTCVQPPHSG